MEYRTGRSLLATFCIAFVAMLIAPSTYGQMPAFNITQQPDALPIPKFIGEVAAPQPINAPAIPRHPFMAPNGRSNVHNDAYMSDTYVGGGPLGQNPQVRPTSLGGLCVSTTFDSAGRIITLCQNLSTARLFLIKPGKDTLELKTLASLDLPSHKGGATDFSAGGYFYLDNNNHALIPTSDRTIWKVAVAEGTRGPYFRRVKTYNLSNVLDVSDSILSVLPDFTGRLWFATTGGVVGTINPKGGRISITSLDQEKIGNSFAIDETGGIFIASDHAMYRFDAGPRGQPVQTWREAYDRGNRLKPGQVNYGTGTTPTLMGSDYVSITDNADPRMHVLVYRRAPVVSVPRLVCSEPVFTDNMSATENSLIATDKSIIVENNYGYGGMEDTMYGRTTTAGITRIDLDDGGGCHTVWTSMETVPSVVSKMSLQNGLIYTYTKDAGPANTDAWYFTAINFHTGQTVFKRVVGTGYCYNNHYAGIYLGPDQTAYVGVLSGLAAIRDTAASADAQQVVIDR